MEGEGAVCCSDWLPKDPPQGAAGDHKEEQDGSTDFPEEEVPETLWASRVV